MKRIEKIETIFSQGSSPNLEDGFVFNPPIFGVVDATSAPYSDENEKILFKGRSGGEMVRRTILKTFDSLPRAQSLRHGLLQANQKIKEKQVERGIPIKRSDLLAGASFVFMKVIKDKVEIIQGGDCFALWVTSEQKGVTKNQVYPHDFNNLKKIVELMKKHHGDRKKMWAEYVHILSQTKLNYVNKPTETGYASLNGQPWVIDCWQEKLIVNPKFLLLFSDGLVPFEETGDPQRLITTVLDNYEMGGLNLLLARQRELEYRNRETSYTDHQEATGMAVHFPQLT